MALDTKAPSLAIAFSVTELLTVILSLFRLGFRLKIRRFWWEDMWAAIAMVGAAAFAITSLISFQTKNFETAKVAQSVASYLFTNVVWSVRMSLLYSIIRVISPSTCLRNFTRAIGALFVIVWALLVALKTWWCVSNLGPASRRWGCLISNPILIFEVTADFAGDAILVVLSLRLLWRVKLPRRQRRMILSIFSSSAIMSIVSLPHAIAQVVRDGYLRYVVVSLELITSLVVCNLLVVVTYIYRAHLSSSESENSSEDDDFTIPMPRSTRSLTTVDLNTPDPTTTGATNQFRSSFLPSLVHSTAS